MTEQKIKNTKDDDFKYVMMDTGNIYLGAKCTFMDLMENEMVPFKLKAIMTHYVFKEADAETTLESQFYYMEAGNFLYETFIQLRTKVKVNVLSEKKNLFGKTKMQYTEKIYSLKELAAMNLAKKKASGMIVSEIIISKLGMMTFSV